MSVVVKRIAMAMLLSTALANGQAEGKLLSRLSAELESLNNLCLKMFESKTTLNASCAVTGVCTGGALLMVQLGLLDVAGILGGLSFASFLSLAHSTSSNRDRQHREAYELEKKIIEELYKQGQSEGMTLYQAAKRLKETTRLADDSVEVNDRIDMFLNIFMRVDWPYEPYAVDMHRIEELVDEHGGYPLTVEEDGLLFNNNNFASYTDLFGETIIVDHTQEEVGVTGN